MATSFAKSLLHDRDLKATGARTAVIEAIQSYGSAMPYADLQAALPGTDRTTLYRTLQALLDKGILHKAHTADEETYYALCGKRCTAESHTHQHAHFKCTVCETVTCVPLEKEVAITLSTHRIEGVHIGLTGVCGGCG